MESSVKDSERIVRLLSREWFIDGQLLHIAFALRQGETYISVNRPSVNTFDKDVAKFVRSHSNFSFGDGDNEFRSADLIVGSVRMIEVELDGVKVNIDVDVEPRDMHIKSHAGIFTKQGNRIVKSGESVVFAHQNACVPADAILLKVRKQLLKMAVVKQSALL